VVGLAIDASCYGIGVFDGRVVVGGPLGAHEAESYAAFAAAAVAADGDGYAGGVVHCW